MSAEEELGGRVLAAGAGSAVVAEFIFRGERDDGRHVLDAAAFAKDGTKGKGAAATESAPVFPVSSRPPISVAEKGSVGEDGGEKSLF
jgi:hypothetical protein